MFLFIEGFPLIIRRLFFNSNTNFLFSWVIILQLSKDEEWLQNNKQSLTALPLGLTFFLVNSYIKEFCTFTIVLNIFEHLQVHFEYGFFDAHLEVCSHHHLSAGN